VEAGVLQRYEFRLAGWWALRAFSRNPLVRTTDRLEVAIIGVAILVVLIAVPFVGALGTAVHDTRSRIYAEEARSRHLVRVTALSDSTATLRPNMSGIVVRGRWDANGSELTGEFATDHKVKAGDHPAFWVDNDGNQVDAPTPSSRAAVDAVSVAVVTWWSLALGSAASGIAARTRLQRWREAAWDREIRLLADGGGRANTQP
jgi:hypothetical protein